MEDDSIIDMYINRNEDAIQCTAIKYGKRLRLFSYSITRDIDSAEECENDTYLAAWGSIQPNQPRKYFYVYLSKIIRNLSLNICREKNSIKRKAFIIELTCELEQCIPGNMNIENTIDETTLKGLINNFLKNLNKDKRTMFVRRYWYLDSIQSISEQYHITENNAKTILFRIRENLKKYLEKEGYFK